MYGSPTSHAPPLTTAAHLTWQPSLRVRGPGARRHRRAGPGGRDHRGHRHAPVTDLASFQELMERTYGGRDRARGRPATVAWLAEEVGELARSVRKGTADEQLHELG